MCVWGGGGGAGFKTSSPKGNDFLPESQKIHSLDKSKVAVDFTIYGHGGHFGHVTWIFLYIHWFPLPIDVSYKIWLSWETMFE